MTLKNVPQIFNQNHKISQQSKLEMTVSDAITREWNIEIDYLYVSQIQSSGNKPQTFLTLMKGFDYSQAKVRAAAIQT